MKLPKRILILGDPGSGKNFLGEKLGKLIKIRLWDLDDIRFKRKFDIIRPKQLRIKIVNNIAKKSSWIIAGAAASWIDNAVKKSDKILILREKLLVEIFRVIIRYFKRKFQKPPPKETLKGLFELILYDYREFHKKDGPSVKLFNELKKKYKNKVIVLKSKTEVNLFLKMIERPLN